MSETELFAKVRLPIDDVLHPAWEEFILREAAGVSDIYIYSNSTAVVRSRRVNSAIELPSILHGIEAFKSFLRMISNEDLLSLAETRKGQGLDYSLALNGMRFRVNIGIGAHGMDVTMRRINEGLPSFEFVRLPDRTLDDFCKFKAGLILVSGATGRGKSTTLAALIQARAERMGGQFETLEDPIEYRFQNMPDKNAFFRQRELGKDFITFAGGLKDELRRAFDVLLVQEIRDSEVALMALDAAQSGHLVLATVHAESVQRALSRYLDLLISANKREAIGVFAENIRMIISQDLLFPEDGGVVPIHEIMVNDISGGNMSIETLIREQKCNMINSEMEGGSKRGMQTFRQCKLQRARAGEIPLSWVDKAH